MPEHDDLIQRLEAALNALKAGDEAPARALMARIGDSVGRDKVEVGAIDRSIVAIGGDIRLAVDKLDLPQQVVSRLMMLADQLEARAAAGWRGEKRQIDIFLASPGDVSAERQHVMDAVREIQNDPQYKDRVELNIIAWDAPDTHLAMVATKTPQDAISEGLGRPSRAHIVIVIFWSRMGQPLPLEDYDPKPEAFRFPVEGLPPEQFYSGTEWEFIDAVLGVEHSGNRLPIVALYRRTEAPDLFDAERTKRNEKIAQYDRVEAFFEFVSNRRGVNGYPSPGVFRQEIEAHLRGWISDLMKRDDLHPVQEGRVTVSSEEMRVEWPADRSPFPGLRAFTTVDEPVFYGRAAETAELLKRVEATGFVAVIGASGAGKSSLVGAGLIPRLAANAIEGGKDWLLPAYHQDLKEWSGLRFTPGEAGDPFLGLALKLRPLVGEAAPALAARLREDPAGIGPLIEQALAGRPAYAKALIFIDQFEELFTLVREGETRDRFAKLLAALAAAPRARTVATMRADFADRCAEYEALNALVSVQASGTFWLGRPRYGALYEMISRPAERAGLRYEEGLNGAILDESGNEPGALALTAYALEQLWRAAAERGDGWLRRSDYAAFGGVAGAIGAQAQKAYDGLAIDEALKEAALRRVFARLVSVSRREDGQGYTATRRRAPLADLMQQAESAEAQLVTRLAQERLLVTDRDSASGANLLEVAHEALLRNWPPLHEWIQQAGEALRLVEDLKRQVARWLEDGKNPRLLWPQEDMDPVLAALEKHPELRGELDEDCWRFLRPEYDRIWEAINAPVPEIRDDTERREYHRRRAVLGDRLNDLGDCEKRPGIGLVKGLLSLNPHEGSAPMLGGRAASGQITLPAGARRLWGDQPEHEALPDILWLPVSGGQQAIEKHSFMVKPFLLAQYPVTNWQFRAFEDADDGWENPRWWQGLAADNDDRQKKAPNRPTGNHPRETVSWYGALAFCAWLSARLGYPTLIEWLQSTGNTWENYPGLRLPAEWEWQWAASGEGRNLEYPFGAWDGAKANTSESGLSRTTAAGLYPAGAAPCGALDLSGNVLEWCLNEYQVVAETGISGSNNRVVRGGSWLYDLSIARVSDRDYWNPYARNYYSGFRPARSLA